ncbi:MAG: DMT family transporter [Chloroflexota bacterium]|nr:DMT family transporter [Chloroflexota bacterium]
MKTRDIGLLFLLASIWGSSFIFISVSAPVIGPFWVVLIRTALGCLTLLAFALLTGQRGNWRRYWNKYLILGALNVAIPFALISAAELELSSALAAILNATTPLFSALVVAVWFNDKLTLPRLVGLALGIIGVALVVGWDAAEMTPAFILGAVMSLVASLFYAIGTSYAKTRFKESVPVTMAIGQLGAAAILVLPFALANPPQVAVGIDVIGSMLTLGILCTAVAYLIYFRLLATAGATNTTTVTFLAPFFSILWSWLFLGETIGAPQFIGLLVILSGLFLVTGFRPAFLRPRKTVPQPS